MGGKRLSKGYPVLFYLAFGLGVMVLLSSCQGVGGSLVFHKGPDYEADFKRIEQVQSLIGQEKFKSALAENEKLVSRYDYKESRSGDDDRVIRVSARINATLLKKVIQDEKNLFTLLQKNEQQDLMIKELTAEMDKLTIKLQGMNTLFKALADLEMENKTLQQQIKDFKKIDLEGDKINADM